MNKFGTPRRLSFERIGSVIERTGLSRSTLYERMQQGTFPRQIKLGVRAVGFLSSEVDNWILDQVKASRAAEDMEDLAFPERSQC